MSVCPELSEGLPGRGTSSFKSQCWESGQSPPSVQATHFFSSFSFLCRMCFNKLGYKCDCMSLIFQVTPQVPPGHVCREPRAPLLRSARSHFSPAAGGPLGPQSQCRCQPSGRKAAEALKCQRPGFEWAPSARPVRLHSPVRPGVSVLVLAQVALLVQIRTQTRGHRGSAALCRWSPSRTLPGCWVCVLGPPSVPVLNCV